ncbi:hypothetical protein BH11MYX3_BH11MYX3_40620 [soil metagenome]
MWWIWLAGLGLLAGCESSSGAQDAAIDAGTDAAIDAQSCACTYGQASVAGTITSPGAAELSGLVASHTVPGLVWTHNDSGDGARLFAVSTTGIARGVGTLAGATATDWEDIAWGPCGSASCLFVADIGDNALGRTSVQIYEVDEPSQINGPVNLTYRAFDVAYPDGPHNAESLFVDPRDGATYVITKQATNPSTVFRMPRTAGVMATAVSAGTITIPSGTLLITAADLHADACGVRLLVRTYDALFELRGAATVTIAQLLSSTPVPVPHGSEMQGEAVTYLPDGRSYLTVSEGASPALSRVACN